MRDSSFQVSTFTWAVRTRTKSRRGLKFPHACTRQYELAQRTHIHKKNERTVTEMTLNVITIWRCQFPHSLSFSFPYLQEHQKCSTTVRTNTHQHTWTTKPEGKSCRQSRAATSGRPPCTSPAYTSPHGNSSLPLPQGTPPGTSTPCIVLFQDK